MWRIKIKTLWALGLRNFYHVMLYRLLKKGGWYGRAHQKIAVPSGPFFHNPPQLKQHRVQTHTNTLTMISSNWQENIRYFGHKDVKMTAVPPDWHLNPFTGTRTDATQPWWKISDFSSDAGDIKVLWEASRWDWVLVFALRSKFGQKEAFYHLNHWIHDWCERNPPYRGVNWKCGQEAAIRVLHLAMAALLLEQTNKPLQSMIDLVEMHLKRIALTFRYALAQDNNHATSEAAALFVGGSWLVEAGVTTGRAWARQGRKFLERLVRRLIATDGSFSQYSTNYHRVVLDTLSMVELWRRRQALPRFSSTWENRAAVAAEWLASMVDPQTGDAPNLGANDGARLLPLTETDYRDFRPSVQLAMALFKQVHAYPSQEGQHQRHEDRLLEWLGISIDGLKPRLSTHSRLLDKGGYAILKRSASLLVVRYPRFRFRPSQADALHLDFWINGENWLRDGGTYSYHASADALRYFPGTESHNTVQMDRRDQMPRLGRFLFGDWLKAFLLSPLEETSCTTTFGVGYRDGRGAVHKRNVELKDNHLRVIDQIEGFTSSAILRWRLKPGDWQLKGHTLFHKECRIQIKTSIPLRRFELIEGWESRYYLQKSPLPVLELELTEPGRVTTDCHWSTDGNRIALA